MRVFSFLFCCILFGLSCGKKVSFDDGGLSGPLCDAVVVSSKIYQDLAPNQASVIEVSIEDDCLTIMLGVSGCDSDHIINLVSDGVLSMTSLSTSITFDFQDENPQLCEAYFTLERQYDLSPIKDLFEGDVSILFRNSELSVLYQN